MNFIEAKRGEAVGMDVIDLLIFIFELLGTVAFAVSGGMAAIQRRMDLFGVLVLGCTTACGGGMIRDILLGRTPPAVFQNPVYIITAALSLCVLALVLHFDRGTVALQKLISVFDTVGLGIFCVVGADTAIRAGFGDNMFLVVFVGVCTGIGGGMLRDILADRAPTVLRRELYALPGICGSVAYFLLLGVLPRTVCMLCGAAVTIAFRFAAVYFGWHLPVLGDKAGRSKP